MERFDVYIKRKSRDNTGPEFSDLDTLSLIPFISILCSQEDIEYFTIERRK